MRIELFHGDDRSAIVTDGTTIAYQRKIHRYESEGDYRTIVTELVTYGEGAAQAVIDYLAARRR